MRLWNELKDMFRVIFGPSGPRREASAELTQEIQYEIKRNRSATMRREIAVKRLLDQTIGGLEGKDDYHQANPT